MLNLNIIIVIITYSYNWISFGPSTIDRVVTGSGDNTINTNQELNNNDN